MAAGAADSRRLRGCLIEQDEERGNPTYDLGGDNMTIGRDPHNDVVLAAKTVSRRHAALKWDGQLYVLTDLNSHSGVYVNGEQLSAPYPLRDGDQIVLGGVVLVFESGETQDWSPRVQEHDTIRIDLARAQVWVSGKAERLTTQEYRALGLLYRKRGELVSKEALVNQIWPEYQGGVADDTLAQLIFRLRRKLGDDSDQPRYLHTIRGLGYRLTVA